MIDRVAKAQFAAPPPLTRYFAVNVVLPGARPLRTSVALARCTEPAARITALASAAAIELAPVATNDMKHEVEAELPSICEETVMSTRPDAGTGSVIDGPTVARSP